MKEEASARCVEVGIKPRVVSIVGTRKTGYTGTGCRFVKSLGLAEVGEHRVDELEGLVDLFADLCSRKNDLAGDEDEKHNLRLHHAVDQTREKLGLVR